MKGKELRNDSIGWSPDGKVIVIRDTEHLSKTWLPLFFSDAKFASFTRKLYRWGFRKTFPPSPQQDNEATICFRSDNFQRDEIALLSKMNSRTAEKERTRITRCSAASFSNKQDNGDALQQAPNHSPLVHRSSSPDGSQQLTTQQGFQWSLNHKAQANMSLFQSLNGIDIGSFLHPQDSATPSKCCAPMFLTLSSFHGPLIVPPSSHRFRRYTVSFPITSLAIFHSKPSYPRQCTKFGAR